MCLGDCQSRNHEIHLFITKLAWKITKWRMRRAPSWKWLSVSNTLYLMFFNFAIAKIHFCYICDMTCIHLYTQILSLDLPVRRKLFSITVNRYIVASVQNLWFSSILPPCSENLYSHILYHILDLLTCYMLNRMEEQRSKAGGTRTEVDVWGC
jgi:hypothetical protein